MSNYCSATNDLGAYLERRDAEDSYDEAAYELEDELKATFREEAQRKYSITTDKGVDVGMCYLANEDEYSGLVKGLIAANDCEGLMELCKKCIQRACEEYINEYVDDEFGKKTIDEWMDEHAEADGYNGEYD